MGCGDVEHRLGCCLVSVEDTNLITEFGEGCCRLLRLDVVEYGFGMMLRTGLGCCRVAAEDINLILEFGVGCFRVFRVDEVEYWTAEMSSIVRAVVEYWWKTPI